nr:unknown protein [Arabidopsis thaliana]
MFNFWGSKEQQQGQSRPSPEASATPWYSPSLVTSPSSSRPQTSGQIPSHVSPGEAAGIIAILKDKSVDELRKLLSDKDAYQQFLHSLDQVTIQNNVSGKHDIREELRKETLHLARENLEKEPQIVELRNQVNNIIQSLSELIKYMKLLSICIIFLKTVQNNPYIRACDCSREAQ